MAEVKPPVEAQPTPEAKEAQSQSAGTANEVEALKAALALKENEADTAKKDLVALKKGKKRDEVTAEDMTETAPDPAPDVQEELRKKDEIIRSLQQRQNAAPVAQSSSVDSRQPATPTYFSAEQRQILKTSRFNFNEEAIARAEKYMASGNPLGTNFLKLKKPQGTK